ncbi:DUF3021 domain-containing protein [uncultured Ruminococcus sp.]|jgi:hypothetical protein|uniref:DUF3021 domain-containing protein n=1 Tax=uncultured Ruminococcus sp. TaxID=165186 RepID=UPI0015692C21|nr:DUF3021 domain-containing protein [uncultured Ruminococcus sp.]
MRKNIKDFFKRGLLAAWGGPVILAIVWAVLKSSEVVEMLTVDQVVLGIISTTVMAFIAAGVSVVYQIESLPKAFAGLIQAAVLYIDYLGIYLLNGWIPLNRVWIFTIIFFAGFIIIWLAIYVPIKLKVNKINRNLRS